MDRHTLAAWSLDLDDARYVRALAALGALYAIYPRALQELNRTWPEQQQVDLIRAAIAGARQVDGLLEWQLPPPHKHAVMPAASTLSNSWQAFIDEAPWGTRIAVKRRKHHWNTVLPMLLALQRPEVGASSAFLTDAFASDGRIDWQLPFHYGVLPDDPMAEAFTVAQAQWREPWPYRFIVADRSQPRVEMLVFSGSLRQTAGRLLAKGTTSKAAIVLLLGGMDAGNQEVESLVRIIARELSAEGVICVTPIARASPDDAMSALQRLGDELCHNFPLDMALRRVFAENVTAFLGRDVLQLSHISHAVSDLAERLQALPEEALIALTEASLGQLIASPEIVGSLEMVSDQDMADVPRMTTRALGPVRRVSPGVLARSLDESMERYRYVHESDEASSLTEVTNELKAREATRAVEEPETRFIQHSFWRKLEGELVEERQRLLVDIPVQLRVRIGPPDERWQSAPVAFPAHKLPRSRGRHRLQVVFHEPTQLDAPMVDELWLPRSGPSSVVEFVFTPRKHARFEGRITVLHRGRVLQTVLIHTQVVFQDEQVDTQQGITQQIEARVREHWSDLGSRRRFDVSFVLNHMIDERPLLTGVSGKRAWATDLSGIKEPVDTINQLLSDVAHSVDDYGEGLTKGDNLKLFYKLARQGSDLYSALVIDHLQQLRSGGMDVEEATHIQIISTRADAVVPFEFIYQYEPPDDESDVKFCPNMLQALVKGTCPGDCDGQKEPRRHVCPMGFWSLRKVIERHIYNPVIGKPGEAEVIVQAEPAGDRVRLQLDQAALVGYSNEVKQEDVSPVIQLLQGRLKGPVREVNDWTEWKAAVAGNHPTLLIAFPHNSGDKQEIALEIGGQFFKTLRLPREYVHVEGPYPLVILLGCDVASTAQQYANHIRYFRQAGAAAIVSTIATVFGPHAVKVGEKLIEGLLDIHERSVGQAGPASKPCLGEALRDAKRKALLDSLPMALCVVAFGDADWRL